MKVLIINSTKGCVQLFRNPISVMVSDHVMVETGRMTLHYTAKNSELARVKKRLRRRLLPYIAIVVNGRYVKNRREDK